MNSTIQMFEGFFCVLQLAVNVAKLQLTSPYLQL
jgi:hypothetical protein